MTENHPHFVYSASSPSTDGYSPSTAPVSTGPASTATQLVEPSAPTSVGSCQKAQEACRIARSLFDQGPDWVTFFREVLGLNGVVRKMFTTTEAMIGFEQSEEFEKIQHMLAKLRESSQANQNTATFEPTRVITVRLPKSLHESLRAEAHEKRTSMNKLCISKLLQFIDNDLVPAEA